MKVRDILKKYRMCSNAGVIIEGSDPGVLMELEKDDIRDLKPNWVMNATVHSFEVIDNVMTIYIKGGR